MERKNRLTVIILFLVLTALTAGCTGDDACYFTSNTELTLYRVPDASTPFWGVEPAGYSYELKARTVDGWVGYEPGVAQAGNTGLARLRFFKLNVLLDPTCVINLPVVTTADVMADMPQPQPPPPDPSQENMVITQVTWTPQILVENQFADVEVTVENQGDAPAENYLMVIFPQHGLGPQNPGGQIAVPDLDPGESFSTIFQPGIIYSAPGTYTLRVLVTDNWTSNTTGTAGDIADNQVKVILGLCNPFADQQIPVVILSLPGDTRILPFYLKVAGGVQGDPDQYRAQLGEIEAKPGGGQGFEDRIYFMASIPEGEEGTAKQLKVWFGDCPDPVLTHNNFLIPIASINCSADLGKNACEEAGGTYKESRSASGGECVCP